MNQKALSQITGIKQSLCTNLTIFISLPFDSPVEGFKRTRSDYSFQKFIAEYLLTLLPAIAEELG